MRYHTEKQIWSDHASAAEKSNMRTWDRQADPEAAYALYGWSEELTNGDPYDGTPTTSLVVRHYDGDGAWSHRVNGDPWRNHIDTEEVARREAAEAAAKAERDAQELEDLRQAKIEQLHAWWDSYPGIEVLPGIVLPTQEQVRNTNTGAFVLAMQINSLLSPLNKRNIKLVDVNDYTVEVPHLQALSALNTFESVYYGVSQHWDTTHKAIVAASTIEELNSIQMEPSNA